MKLLYMYFVSLCSQEEDNAEPVKLRGCNPVTEVLRYQTTPGGIMVK